VVTDAQIIAIGERVMTGLVAEFEDADDGELVRMMLLIAAQLTASGQFLAAEPGLDAQAIARDVRQLAQLWHERLLMSFESLPQA
jgi:hypothetical protein